MSALLVSDLLKVFDNYEPSRTRVWEIVRTVHPVHCAALLYLLENVSKSCKTAAFKLPISDDDKESLPAIRDRVYKTSVRPTLNLTRATVTRQLRPVPRHGSSYTYDLRDASGNLTVIGLMHIVRDDNAFERLTLEERVVMHNLRTAHYTQFVQNVQHFLLPDDMHCNRNAFENADMRNVTQKFLQYYHSLGVADDDDDDDNRIDASLYYCGNLNPKSFRYVTRPPCRQLHRRPLGLETDYIVQPLYRGYRVVINSNDRETRCYNCYGDLIHGFLYDVRFTANATFEAIVLPLDRDKRLRSWRYGVHNNKKNLAVFVVDVFRVDHRILVQLPFVERAAHIHRILGDSVRQQPAECTWDSLERSYHGRADLFDPVVGVVVRRKDASCADPPQAYRFNMTACYDFLTDTVTRLAGNVSLKEFQRIHFNLDMADRRTVCTVYAHDDLHYYVCAFDRRRYQFVHYAALDRLTDIARIKPKYRSESIYVIGAKRLPMGVMFLRVYYSEHDLSIVGFEHKLTTSMYDVPYEDPFLSSTSS